MSREIENSIGRSDWKEARQLVRAALRAEPDSHWLLARLSLTYYEEFDYERALIIVKRAYDIAPGCPLVLWELAGTLDMLGREREAISIYRRLIGRGVESVAFGKCGEGLSRARGLIADCWYRLAHCERNLGHGTQAIQCYQRHIASRGPGCHSIYLLRNVRKELQKQVTALNALLAVEEQAAEWTRAFGEY
jgi:tetratricopeptide (TPR) repeat protein